MKRDIQKLKTERFNVIVIGGGIHGATIAWECSKRGYKTCLIEKNDFGSQTSANSLKVLHGGLRYLQHANFKRMRESIYSRKIFQQIAPHLVYNVPFLIPTSGYTIKSKFALSVAMFLNDLISFDRNKNIENKNFIPGGKTISKKKFAEIVTNYNKKYNGGAVWYETIALNTERLLFEFLYRAYNNNATLANYVKAEAIDIENRIIKKVQLKDQLTGEEFYAEADYVINSVGPWLNDFLKGTKDYDKLYSPLTKAVNIVVKKNYFKEYAVGLESEKEFTDKAAVINKGKRLFFFVPIGNYTMIGTTYKKFDKSADECIAEKEDIEKIITEINAAYKSLNLKYEDITLVHVGTQAMPDVKFENEFDVQPETHSVIFDHSMNGEIENLISVKSVKYTTAPSIAKKISELLSTKIKPIQNNTQTNIDQVNYGEQKKSFFKKNNYYDNNLLTRLWNTYGTKSQYVIDYIEQNKETQKLILKKPELYLGEIKYNIEKEMAITVEDVIHRRLGLTAFEKLPHNDKEKIETAINYILTLKK